MIARRAALTCRSTHSLVGAIRPPDAAQEVEAVGRVYTPRDASGLRIRIGFRSVRGAHRLTFAAGLRFANRGLDGGAIIAPKAFELMVWCSLSKSLPSSSGGA